MRSLQPRQTSFFFYFIIGYRPSSDSFLSLRQTSLYGTWLLRLNVSPSPFCSPLHLRHRRRVQQPQPPLPRQDFTLNSFFFVFLRIVSRAFCPCHWWESNCGGPLLPHHWTDAPPGGHHHAVASARRAWILSVVSLGLATDLDRHLNLYINSSLTIHAVITCTIQCSVITPSPSFPPRLK